MNRRLLTLLMIATLVSSGCGSDGGSTTAATVPTTTTTASPPPPITATEALEVAGVYFDAYNTGDAEAVLALTTPDASFSDNFGPQSRDAWEQLLAWNVAQGTMLEAVECTVANENDGPVTVVCEFENRDALVQAVDGPSTPVTHTMSITVDGVSDWDFAFGQPDFNTVWNPFRDWMSDNHPDDVANIGFGNWSSIAEATENGFLTAQYAESWRAYLDERDCTYSDEC
jgi:hypothetical protein